MPPIPRILLKLSHGGQDLLTERVQPDALETKQDVAWSSCVTEAPGSELSLERKGTEGVVWADPFPP